MAESSGGVPGIWGRLDGEIARFEMGGLTDLGELGRLGDVQKAQNSEGNGSVSKMKGNPLAEKCVGSWVSFPTTQDIQKVVLEFGVFTNLQQRNNSDVGPLN